MTALPNQELIELAKDLENLRDLWLRVSIDLKDFIADAASPSRDEMLAEVERFLAKIRENE